LSKSSTLYGCSCTSTTSRRGRTHGSTGGLCQTWQAFAAHRQRPNPLVVNISARHCHLTPEAVETLFGKGAKLTVHKWLYQDGQFAAKETVTLIGPRSRVISNLRILGPCRNLNQVELAYTDAIALGFEIPLRSSGDIKGTPGCMLMGPAGFFEMPQGVIRAIAPRSHDPTDADFYGVKAGDHMKLKIGGPCGITLEKCSCAWTKVSSWKSTLTPTKATRAICSRTRR
jgi:putative phosphotransacetylase